MCCFHDGTTGIFLEALNSGQCASISLSSLVDLYLYLYYIQRQAVLSPLAVKVRRLLVQTD